ncbi:MAG: ATP-dependent DNA helicase RecQ [Gemmatimonadaceae bacterium]|nr:ATP-dependent DNA helicase RecQ [Gemmatimonadaceae bacterium]
MTAPTLADARSVLKTHFGYDAFRAGQERAVESVLEGADTLVVLPTGGGKSLCFQVPALMLPGLTVVLSPLISLMKDQVDTLTRKGLAAAFINSTLSSNDVQDRLARAANGEIKILYMAPERFDSPGTAERLRRIGVSLLAVDEAHCISQWGHDFRPSYLRVSKVRTELGNPPTIALTATATPEVRSDISNQLKLREPTVIITGFDRINLTYHVLPAKNDAAKDALLIETLKRNEGLAVVYAATRKTVERVTSILQKAKVNAIAYHAGLNDKRRREVQDAFMNERVRAIVATNAFGMGIDKPNVRLVVHHSMPGTLEAYYQEAGRAGRDGLPANVFLLHSFPDRFTHEFFIKGAYPEKKEVERVYNRLRQLAEHDGSVNVDMESLPDAIGGKASPREIESALRILTVSGAVGGVDPNASVVRVRLLATPARIKRELGPGDAQELGLLRTLWRTWGDRFHDGVLMSFDALPPGLAGASRVIPILDSLQSRQILVWERIGEGFRVNDATTPFHQLNIDWATIDKRRASELSKLQMVQLYAYTKACRRGFVLKYFGDPAARSNCGTCDNCLGLVHEPANVQEFGVPKPSRRKKGIKEKIKKVFGASDDPDGERVAVALRSMRTQIAKADKVPPYVVFSDRTLDELCSVRPRTESQLLEVSGIGPMKLDRYGAQILDAIRNSGSTEAA